ncbi:serine dehydratase subunit alpha family protein [Fusobacterium perfoetens]|uniref:L-cysteine desulfidase family protein n=1 Tax=Fusobacterium perfoetens TaxID=852 RepID=UPI001F204017|nr:L-serine ammonia-lyase, iron-sulfur-dependent, subunit alpha [Fusobacterium perfoetens]MCF2625788.1 serine dehydratase subunit alpha family protein [Fusobacterium perfoetens]
MEKLTELIFNDMKPALGVTEPGAIAFAASKAVSFTKGNVEEVSVEMNSGMYKNAFTCGIPNSDEVGNIFAAALGVIAGNPEKGLESLADVTEEDNKKAEKLVKEGRVKVKLSGISSDIFIEATVKTETDICVVTIKDTHTNIVKISLNGKTVFEKADEKKENEGEEIPLIHKYTLKEIIDYAKNVDIEEIKFIKKAFEVNMELFNEGLKSSKSTFIHQLFKMNGEKIFSDDVLKTAQLLCNGAIEARVIGLDKPAMSITGSGAHGIIAVMPLLAEQKVKNLSEEILLRGAALSYLVCMYIKEYSGRLSAFCGCGIAAGTGMACAIVFMRNGSYEEMSHTINNMASSITGMICDGGNQGCTMKGIAATDTAFRSAEFAMNGVYIYNVHGINGNTPEETMRNMGLIASPGMTGTEKTIVEIFENKIK